MAQNAARQCNRGGCSGSGKSQLNGIDNSRNAQAAVSKAKIKQRRTKVCYDFAATALSVSKAKIMQRRTKVCNDFAATPRCSGNGSAKWQSNSQR